MFVEINCASAWCLLSSKVHAELLTGGSNKQTSEDEQDMHVVLCHVVLCHVVLCYVKL